MTKPDVCPTQNRLPFYSCRSRPTISLLHPDISNTFYDLFCAVILTAQERGPKVWLKTHPGVIVTLRRFYILQIFLESQDSMIWKFCWRWIRSDRNPENIPTMGKAQGRSDVIINTINIVIIRIIVNIISLINKFLKHPPSLCENIRCQSQCASPLWW